MRSFPDPNAPPHEFRDEFHRTLWEQALVIGLRDADAGERAAHLARGYGAGVDADEILARIDCGEIDGVRHDHREEDAAAAERRFYEEADEDHRGIA